MVPIISLLKDCQSELAITYLMRIHRIVKIILKQIILKHDYFKTPKNRDNPLLTDMNVAFKSRIQHTPLRVHGKVGYT